MNVTREQSLFINSENRLNGSINDFQVFLNDQIVQAENINTQIKLSVIHLSINRSYYTVENNIAFQLICISNQINNVIFTIPSGYYDVFTFRTYLLTILINWTITYSKSTNTYTFISPIDGNVYAFQFFNCGNLFGFDNGITSNFDNSIPITSTKPILMNIDTSLFIRTDIPRTRYGCLDNLKSTTFQESDILCAVPQTFSPFNTITLSDSNQFSFYMSCKDLNSFRLYITDQNGNSIPLRHDYTIALKFEYISPQEQDESLETMQEIRDLLKYITLHKYL